jgi:hypothetical protein
MINRERVSRESSALGFADVIQRLLPLRKISVKRKTLFLLKQKAFGITFYHLLVEFDRLVEEGDRTLVERVAAFFAGRAGRYGEKASAR